MASSVEKELAKHLECGICLERFEEPKVLTCQHSYCEKCLERLMTTNEITCPECRRKIEVPSGDVKSLPTNFLIKNLLSIRGSDQSNASSSPPCHKHDGKIIKLFCKTCDQLICRDCIIVDHRDHEYSFVKDVLPAVKEEILDIVQKSRADIRSLESSIETIKKQDDDVHRHSMELNLQLDSFIDKLIEPIERKRQSIKDDLRQLFGAQKNILDAQRESFHAILDCLKSSVQLTEETLTRGSEVEILFAKKQMVEQLTELSSSASDLKPRGRIFYSLKLTDSPIINPSALKRVATITEYDDEYEILKSSGLTLSKDLRTRYFDKKLTKFYIRPKSKSSTLDQASKVQVKIIVPYELIPYRIQVPVNNEPDGSFSFSYKPTVGGDYKIEVLVNERSVHGSPFTWKVDNFVQWMVDKVFKA